MSPIGRVFIVFNLMLAGAFLVVAGTFLQKQTHWKDLYEAEQEAHTDAVAEARRDLDDLRGDLTAREQSLTSTNNQLQARTAELEAEKADNERLSRQLDTMEGNLNLLTSQTAAMSSSIDTGFQQAQDAYRQSIAADEAKDQAVQAMEQAVANLRDANFQATQLRDQIQALTAQITELEGDLRQQTILVELAKQNGFVPVLAQPDLRGVVTVVGAAGRLVTVNITENPTGAELTPGLRFAIYNGDTYKGDVLINSIEGTYAFGRLFAGNGTTIQEGDLAATRLN